MEAMCSIVRDLAWPSHPLEYDVRRGYAVGPDRTGRPVRCSCLILMLLPREPRARAGWRLPEEPGTDRAGPPFFDGNRRSAAGYRRLPARSPSEGRPESPCSDPARDLHQLDIFSGSVDERPAACTRPDRFPAKIAVSAGSFVPSDPNATAGLFWRPSVTGRHGRHAPAETALSSGAAPISLEEIEQARRPELHRRVLRATGRGRPDGPRGSV